MVSHVMLPDGRSVNGHLGNIWTVYDVPTNHTANFAKSVNASGKKSELALTPAAPLRTRAGIDRTYYIS